MYGQGLPRTDPACGGRSVPVLVLKRTATRAVPTIMLSRSVKSKQKAGGRYDW